MDALRLILLYWFKRQRQNSRRSWVHRINERRETFGEYHHLMDDVLSDEDYRLGRRERGKERERVCVCEREREREI